MCQASYLSRESSGQFLRIMCMWQQVSHPLPGKWPAQNGQEQPFTSPCLYHGRLGSCVWCLLGIKKKIIPNSQPSFLVGGLSHHQNLLLRCPSLGSIASHSGGALSGLIKGLPHGCAIVICTIGPLTTLEVDLAARKAMADAVRDGPIISMRPATRSATMCPSPMCSSS